MTKTLFISYSHDSEEHKVWVKKFADDLGALGDFDILLDQNMPKGFSLPRFMEQGLANADKVLVIGTPNYKLKAEKGKGVAFEESIISTDLMSDIDSLKYYPILRSGTYETSFPSILIGRSGDDMTNDSKYEETLQIIADAIINEKPLPKIFLKRTEGSVVSSETVANVYLSEYVMLETTFGVTSEAILGVLFGVTVTNTSKEIRYFNKPFFKLSVPLEGKTDTFMMTNMVETLHFPIKLEFGQQFSVSFILLPANVSVFEKILEQDANATVKAIVSTTINERAESEPYQLSKVIKNKKYIR